MLPKPVATRMRAMIMNEAGGPEVLTAAELEIPSIGGAHDVCVRLIAAALNPVDYKMRTRGGLSDRRPMILGCDGAGIVDAVGPGVTRFKPGDEVYFTNGGYGLEHGTYAEYAIVDERFLARKPRRMSFAEAAAVPLVLITAWETLHDRAQIQPGQHVLVQAGAGGVGHVAVQLAALAKARVAATVSTKEKAELAKSLGAETLIYYKSEDVKAAVDTWTDGRGAEIVFDTVGGATFDASFELVAPYGMLATCVESKIPEDKTLPAWRRNLRIGFEWMPGPQVFGWPQARLHQTEILERGAELIDAGELRIIIAATFPLECVVDAHRALESGHTAGKIVLEIAT